MKQPRLASLFRRLSWFRFGTLDPYTAAEGNVVRLGLRAATAWRRAHLVCHVEPAAHAGTQAGCEYAAWLKNDAAQNEHKRPRS